MHMKQLKMLFQVIQISSLNKGVLNSYEKRNINDLQIYGFLYLHRNGLLCDNYTI